MPIDLSQYEAVLVDLDGTLYLGRQSLPGAAGLMQRLRQQGRPFGCLSNTTESPSWASERLKNMGICVESSLI